MNDTTNQQAKAGRPTVITAETVSLLADCFQKGMTVREACWQSGISHEAYYNRLRTHEQFADIMARAQESPTMTAKQVIIEAINNKDVGAAKWWLERKAADEFGHKDKSVKEKPEVTPNPFASMSDEELHEYGVELARMLTENTHIVGA